MAGRGTKVNVGLEVDVTGTKDIDALARSIDDAAKAAKNDLKVSASVDGEKDVQSLADDIGKIPTSTAATVTAKVDGDRDVDGLADDIGKIPASTAAKITAGVAGLTDLHNLADDIAALPATTKASVSVTTDTKGIRDVRDRLGEVKQNVQDAHDDTAGFASEITGTLGGQFSEGAGMVSDFGEQFRNLRDRISEADDKRAALGKAVVGIGGTLLAGFGLDAILGIFSQISEASAETEANIKELSDQIVESGGLIDKQFKTTQAKQIVNDPGFQDLIDAGADYDDVLSGLTGDTEALARVHEKLQTKAEASALSIKENYGSDEQAAAQFNTVNTLDDLAEKFNAVGDSAVDSGRQFNDWLVSAGLADDKVADAADGVDLLGDAMRASGKDTDYATGRVNAFNKTPMKDKSAKIDATDDASPKVDAANKKKLTDKKNKLSADDQVSPAVATANKKELKDKDATLDATDYATGRVNTFNNKAIDDKTATIDADPQPAQNKIDGLDGQTVKVKVDFDVTSLNTDYRVSRVSTSSSSGPVGFAAAAGAAGLSAGVPAPVVRGSLSIPVTAPVQVVINGALDPAAVARQVRQVLTRADRRTGPLRVGNGSNRAPV